MPTFVWCTGDVLPCITPQGARTTSPGDTSTGSGPHHRASRRTPRRRSSSSSRVDCRIQTVEELQVGPDKLAHATSCMGCSPKLQACCSGASSCMERLPADPAPLPELPSLVPLTSKGLPNALVTHAHAKEGNPGPSISQLLLLLIGHTAWLLCLDG